MRLQQSWCYVCLLKFRVRMSLPPANSPHMLQHTPKMEHLRGIATNAFTPFASTPYVTQSSSSFQKHFSLLTQIV